LTASRADLVAMAREYHAHMGAAWPLDEAAFLAVVEAAPYFDSTSDGFLVGTIATHPLSPGWVVAHEVMWWAKGSGGTLARRFRRWAKENGAQEILWECPPGARAEKFYKRTGRQVGAVYSEAL
jgi:hypothetical protein